MSECFLSELKQKAKSFAEIEQWWHHQLHITKDGKHNPNLLAKWVRLDDIEKLLKKYVVVERQKLQEKLNKLFSVRAGSIYSPEQEEGMIILLHTLLSGKRLKTRKDVEKILKKELERETDCLINHEIEGRWKT